MSSSGRWAGSERAGLVGAVATAVAVVVASLGAGVADEAGCDPCVEDDGGVAGVARSLEVIEPFGFYVVGVRDREQGARPGPRVAGAPGAAAVVHALGCGADDPGVGLADGAASMSAPPAGPRCWRVLLRRRRRRGGVRGVRGSLARLRRGRLAGGGAVQALADAVGEFPTGVLSGQRVVDGDGAEHEGDVAAGGVHALQLGGERGHVGGR